MGKEAEIMQQDPITAVPVRIIRSIADNNGLEVQLLKSSTPKEKCYLPILAAFLRFVSNDFMNTSILCSIFSMAAFLIGLLGTTLYWRLRIGKHFVSATEAAAADHALQQAQAELNTVYNNIQWQKQQIETLQSQLDDEKKKASQQMIATIQANNESSRKKAVAEGLQAQLQQMQTQLCESQEQCKLIQQQLQSISVEKAALQTHFEAQQQRLREQQEQMDNYGQQLKKEFQLLADGVLQQKAAQFNQQQESKLTDLLQPLRQRMEEFRNTLTQQFTHASTERVRLEEQVKRMAEMNQQLSNQAENLTKALSSQVKQQGNWGEAILETILQYVGLQKEIHYQSQQTATNHNGETIRPDFVVRYPDNRYLVIDSKVSLVHYNDYCQATSAEEQGQLLGLMNKSMRQHIDGLSAKTYHQLNGSLDFVFMFVPVEGAFITILQHDKSLWQYAFDKRILLASPTLLISGLKLVHELWKQDGINKNAAAIAEKAGKLYDKLAGFVANFEEVGQRLEQAGKAFTQAQGQLRTGRGNAIAQAEALRRMNAVTTKSIHGSFEE